MAPSRHSKAQTSTPHGVDENDGAVELLSTVMDEIEQIGITYHYPVSKGKPARTYHGAINEVKALTPLIEAIQQSAEALFRHDRIRLFSSYVKNMIAAEFVDIMQRELQSSPITPKEIQSLVAGYSPDRLIHSSELVENLREEGIYASFAYDPIVLHDQTVSWKIPPIEDGPMGGKLSGKPASMDAAVEISKRIENMLAYNAQQTSQNARYPAIKDEKLIDAIHDFTRHVIDHHDQKPFKSLSRCELVELIWDSVEIAICNPNAHSAALTTEDRPTMMAADNYRQMVSDTSPWLKANIKDPKEPPRNKVRGDPANTLILLSDSRTTGNYSTQPTRH